MKINVFGGDLSGISAKPATLVLMLDLPYLTLCCVECVSCLCLVHSKTGKKIRDIVELSAVFDAKSTDRRTTKNQ